MRRDLTEAAGHSCRCSSDIPQIARLRIVLGYGMYRRLLVISVVALMTLSVAGCHNKRVQNPIADVSSKQPDKVLFDRSMDFIKHNKFDQARMTLQALINTYPDSEFIARAKLAIGDSWYAEGGTAAWQQAEAEYKDFETFFPNMPEAAEAQFKVASIHYQQMEKPDRDFTHAKRAEEEYRNMIMQYPDSPLVPKAKERLREVQEVLAEREFRIGRFYYLRESWAAAIARLKSLTDTYPLYSGADEALYMLGDSYYRQVEALRAATNVPEVLKGSLIKDYEEKAADAYSRIVTRYPVMPRAEDAKHRLAELKRPIPVPTPEAIAQNKAEEESRQHTGMWGRTMLAMHKRPDTAETARVGEPTMADPQQTSAPEIMRHVTDVITGKGEGSHQVSIEKVGTGTPPANEPVPRSDNQVDPNAQPQTQRQDDIQSLVPNTGNEQQPAVSTTGTSTGKAPDTQVKPESAAHPSSTQSTAQAAELNRTAGDPTPTPPPPVNEVKAGGTSDQASSSSQTDEKNQSSSKKKKKKGLGKLNPF